jgi:transcriptional regulator with XRE-family HTH domain
MTAHVRSEANSKPTLRLRADELDRAARVLFGPLNVRQLADRLGVDHRHFSQLRTGKRNPGPQFIAVIRTEMPNVPFDDLFEVVDSTEDGEAA